MTKRELCLHLLETREWVYTNDFLEAGCGSRFGARIQELRDRGYVIPPAERVRDGQARYRLVRRSACGGSGNPASSVAAGPSNDLRTGTALSLAGPGATAERPCQDTGRAGGNDPLSPAPSLASRGGRSEVEEASVTAISRCLNPYEYEAEEAA